MHEIRFARFSEYRARSLIMGADVPQIKVDSGGRNQWKAQWAPFTVGPEKVSRTVVQACLLAASPKATRCLECSDGFVISTAAPIPARRDWRDRPNAPLRIESTGWQG
jgi:hypothetical protein